MKKLIIMGAGGCGREVLQWALDVNKIQNCWDGFAFLDYDKGILDGKKCNARIVGNDDTYCIAENDEFICAIGNGRLRERAIEKMEKKGAVFTSIIHPSAKIAESVSISNGCIIYPHAVITTDTVIGKGCIINMHCSIAHDVRIGDYCTISPNCHITGACEFGANVFMGVGASVIPTIRIENDAYICAGSVVMTRVKAGTKVWGNPAKRIKAW